MTNAATLGDSDICAASAGILTETYSRTALPLIVTCKNCGRALLWPRNLPVHVLGALCSPRCAAENRAHYDDDGSRSND